VSKITVLAFGFPIDTSGGPHFSDVPPSNIFYPYIETLRNLGVVEGYSDGTFHPNGWVTRAQIAKIEVLSAIQADPGNWHLLNPSTPTFQDVAYGAQFYQYIETAVAHNVLTGYRCGSAPAPACVPPDNKPYYLPDSNATRAQITKIVYLAVTPPPLR
jgi:hypothetical protein